MTHIYLLLLSLSLSLSLPLTFSHLSSLSHPSLHPLTERYKPLLSIRHQLQFLDLQRDLLLEFHQDLGNNWAAVSASPLVPQAAAYLNSANYIATVLKQWGETEVYHCSVFTCRRRERERGRERERYMYSGASMRLLK